MAHINEESNKRAFVAELLNDASIDCVMAVDKDLRIISWNTMCETLSGKPRGSVMGRHITTVYPALADAAPVTDALNDALRGYKSFVAAGLATFGGEHLESHFIPLKDVLGTVTGVLIIRHDVAHRIKAEQELKRLNAALAGKNAELERHNSEQLAFARVTSQDLKEPLRKIHMFIDMLIAREEEQLSETGKSYFRRIQAATLKMETLTDDIYTFSHINNMEDKVSEVALDHVLKFAENNFRHLIAEKSAVLKTGKLPIITGRRVLLYQLFQNLLHNALKFCTPGRRPHISISAEVVPGKDVPYGQAPAGMLYSAVTFADNGIGFDNQYAGQMFELFHRLHPAGDFSGNGIGLAICRKIMDLHGGFICAACMPGEGSRFTCYFPLAIGQGPAL